MYSTSSGRGFLPLVTAAHEISPTCSCMRNPGEEECMIHIRESNPKCLIASVLCVTEYIASSHENNREKFRGDSRRNLELQFYRITDSDSLKEKELHEYVVFMRIQSP